MPSKLRLQRQPGGKYTPVSVSGFAADLMEEQKADEPAEAGVIRLKQRAKIRRAMRNRKFPAMSVRHQFCRPSLALLVEIEPFQTKTMIFP
jgi:hypothetical protein